MKYEIDNQYNQVRLDRWIRTHFPGVPQSLIEKSLRKKDILVNDKKANSSDRLLLGDKITVKKHIQTFDKPSLMPAQFSKADYEILMQSILYESENYLILNKPRGFAVQGGSLVKKSVIDILNSQGLGQQYKIVHRIDKETTGILLLAKTMIGARYFAQLFKENNIKKTYLALTEGLIEKSQGVLRNKLLKTSDRVIEDKDGKDSITEFEVIEKSINNTLVKVRPITGRMHQIRVQLSLIGHPIVGDNKYNSGENNKKQQLRLHAHEIEFVDFNGKIAKFTAPLPEGFEIL